MKAWTKSQVHELEEFYHVRLPGTFTAFLLDDFGVLAGLQSDDPNLLLDLESLKKLRHAAEQMLEEQTNPASLAPNDFVFYFTHGPRFLFFRCDADDEDPPVYEFRYGEPEPELAFKHFSDWVQRLQAGPEEAQVTLKGEPPPITPHLDFSEFVTPEMQAALRQVERRFRPELAEIEPHLGHFVGAFPPATANLVAAVIFGVVMLVLGAAVLGWLIYQAFAAQFQMPFVARHGMSWLMLGLSLVLSAGLAVAGAYLVYWAKRLFQSRLVVGAHGFAWVRPSHAEVVAWSEIREIVETVLRESVPLKTGLKVVLPKSEGRQFEVRTNDGRKLRFSANNVHRVEVFEAILRRAASDLEVPVSVMKAEV
jgi:hypothetical protein